MAIEKITSSWIGRKTAEVVPVGHSFETNRRKIHTRSGTRWRAIEVTDPTSVSLEDGKKGFLGRGSQVPIDILRGDDVTREHPTIHGWGRSVSYGYKPSPEDPPIAKPPVDKLHDY